MRRRGVRRSLARLVAKGEMSHARFGRRGALRVALSAPRDGWLLGEKVQSGAGRPQPQPENDCSEWLFAAFGVSSHRQVSEESSKSGAAGRDAVQTGKTQKNWSLKAALLPILFPST